MLRVFFFFFFTQSLCMYAGGKRDRGIERRRGGEACNKWKFHFPCLSSSSQQLVSVSIRALFSGFSPATCALATKTKPPVCTSTARTFHKNFPQFGFQVWVMKQFLSAFELHSLMYMTQPYCNSARLSKTYFFHHRSYWRDTKGIDPGCPVDHGWNMESTRQTTHVN